MMSDGARFVAALFIAMVIILTIAVATIALGIALQGCAICDNNPPNYVAAAVIAAIAAGVLWVLIRITIRLFANQPTQQ